MSAEHETWTRGYRSFLQARDIENRAADARFAAIPDYKTAAILYMEAAALYEIAGALCNTPAYTARSRDAFERAMASDTGERWYANLPPEKR